MKPERKISRGTVEQRLRELGRWPNDRLTAPAGRMSLAEKVWMEDRKERKMWQAIVDAIKAVLGAVTVKQAFFALLMAIVVAAATYCGVK